MEERDVMKNMTDNKHGTQMGGSATSLLAGTHGTCSVHIHAYSRLS